MLPILLLILNGGLLLILSILARPIETSVILLKIYRSLIPLFSILIIINIISLYQYFNLILLRKELNIHESSFDLRKILFSNSSILIFVVWFFLTFLVIYRLCSNEYNTDPYNLLFYEEGYDVSYSFGNDESYYHLITGMFSVFLFTCIIDFIGFYGQLLGLVSTIYPIYNLIKRATFHSDNFAISSYSNNNMEWALGFYFGINVGIMAKQVYETYQIENERLELKTNFIVNIILNIAGLGMLISAVYASILYYNTWIENNINKELILILPLSLTILILSFISYYQIKKFINNRDDNQIV